MRAAGGVRACVGSAVVVDFDRWGGGMGLAGQYEAGLELGCVKCKILLHRYCSCCDPGFASATRAAKTGIRRVDVVVQRRFEDESHPRRVPRCDAAPDSVMVTSDLGKSSTCVGRFVPRNSSRCICSVGHPIRREVIARCRDEIAWAAQVPPVRLK